MFSHVMVGSNDIARSKKFYDALFGAVGGKPGAEDAKGRLIYAHNGGRLMVSKPIDGKSATHANGGTISFEAPSRAAVAAFHQAALAAGGKDEGAVGPRGFWPNAYAGYVRDLDGNKLAAYCRKPE